MSVPLLSCSPALPGTAVVPGQQEELLLCRGDEEEGWAGGWKERANGIGAASPCSHSSLPETPLTPHGLLPRLQQPAVPPQCLLLSTSQAPPSTSE